jgi:hypothetical protein
MKYRVFISATKKDLSKQRVFAADQLRQADIDVNRMEEWPADAEHPARLSAQRTKGCHFCVAIVAFHRGTIAINDPEKRSITQIEIDTAHKNGAKVLYFLLADTSENRALWPGEHNHLDDAQVEAWRNSIQTNQTCQYFQAGESIDSMPHVLPAVMRQIFQWERKRRRRLFALMAVLVLCLILPVLAVFGSGSIRQNMLSRLHEIHDPVVFGHARDHDYKVARLIDGRSDLRDNTNFREELAATKSSFKMYANQFWTFQEYEQEFEDMLKRHVQIQMILTDFSAANLANVDAFYRATTQTSNSEEALIVTKASVSRIYKLAKRYPDQFELRLNQLQMFYTMWIRDEDSLTGLGHLGVNNYSVVTNWPYFRVSNVTGGTQLRTFKEQFDVLWQKAAHYSEP